MSNLLNYVKNQISDEAISSISSMIGENSSVTKSAISSVLPTVLKGIINRGDTTQNVGVLNKFISDQKIGGDIVSNLLSADNQSKRDSFLSKGAGVTDFLFGSAKSTLLGNIGKASGLASGKASSLTNAIAPLALSYVSKYAKGEKFTDGQFANYLDSQKNLISDHSTTRNETVHTKETKAYTADRAVHHEERSSGGGFLKWLFPLLLIGALAWWFGGRGCNTPAMEDTTKVEEPAVKTAPAAQRTRTVTETTTTADRKVEEVTKIETSSVDAVSGLRIDENGNIVDANGNIIARSGEYSEKDGYYVDASGKRIGLLNKIGKAIGGAATKTADAFKDVFTGIFKSKEKVGSTYSLARIVFDDESHKITNFSKNEVEGLANALKALPGSKIQVQVHSNDGDSDKQNKEFTKLRAEVVRDMLVTLGVDKKQISFKGMGKEDAAKASGEKVEIMVEQTVD